MAMSNTAQIDWLKLLLQNAAWANIGDVGGLQPSAAAGDVFVALHTAEPVDGGDQSSNESTYTGYVRVSGARDNVKWVDNGANGLHNASDIEFAQNGGADQIVTWFSLGVGSAGATQYIVKGQLQSPLDIVNLLTPKFGVGALDAQAV